MAYEVFCKSVQGASHIRKGIPCEDYGIKKETELCKIFALGDGHGDLNCPRSQKGSQFVCTIASEELAFFANDLETHGWTDKMFERAEAEILVSQLITSIFGKWSCQVNDDFEQFPLTEKESEEAVEYIDRYRNGERIEHAYGTTFIAGLLTREYLLLLQQGDGRCVLFDQDGNVSQPIPWDDRCFANVTTSVCDIDAVQSCRYHIVDLTKNKIIACVAGSDGVEDSFNNMDKMHAYYRNLFKYACDNGVTSLESYLEETLPSFSENGSGDDTTICGIIDTNLFSLKLDKMVFENKIIALKNTIASAQERIDSMSGKLAFLKSKYEKALVEFQNVENEYLKIKSDYDDVHGDILAFENELTSKEENGAVKGKISSIGDWLFAKKDGAVKYLSGASLNCLKRHLSDIELLKEQKETTFRGAELRKKACEDEYIQYKETHDKYAKMLEEAQCELTAMQKSDIREE